MQYQVDGQTKTRKVVDPHSFRILTNEAGEPEYHRVQLFTTGDERPGLMNFPFEGLTSGSKYGTAVGIIMFMLVIGGAFGIVMRTGTIDNGILALIRHTRGNEILFIPALFILFSLGGAVALEMALQRPDAVTRLVMINALPSYRIDHWRKWLEAQGIDYRFHDFRVGEKNQASACRLEKIDHRGQFD